jgi:hypothetical protein
MLTRAWLRHGSTAGGRCTPLDAAAGGGTRQENVTSWLKELGGRSDESD